MAKDKIAYVCENCGQESPKWIGKCPACGQWNTFKEIKIAADTARQTATHAAAHVGHALRSNRALRLKDISSKDDPRIDMGDAELNRVLGGGLVPGSIVLLGGEPGIGKSTLTLQTMLRLTDKRILYVSGEESAHQLKMRAERLCAGGPAAGASGGAPGGAGSGAGAAGGASGGAAAGASVRVVGGSPADNFLILCENSLEHIFDHIKEEQPDLVVIDSIQTIATEDVESSAGSIAQVRECAASLLCFAKTSGVPVILIGHITKEGTLAGPKILEHIVDTVIQFEGDQHYMYRILRSIKNRFGSTSELGIYEMEQTGLRQVSNPSELLLTDDHEGLSGVAISSAIEGVRPFLVETQALVSSAAYGTPQRTATGFDQRRLNMLLAVLEKRVGFKLMQKGWLVHGWRGRSLGRGASREPHRAAHSRGRATRLQPHHHPPSQPAGPRPPEVHHRHPSRAQSRGSPPCPVRVKEKEMEALSYRPRKARLLRSRQLSADTHAIDTHSRFHNLNTLAAVICAFEGEAKIIRYEKTRNRFV